MAQDSQQIVRFRDPENDGDALVIVRRVDNRIGLAVSLQRAGDIEVFMGADAARKIAQLLANAAES